MSWSDPPKLPSFVIPHAKEVYGDPDRRTLHVVTDLMHNSDSPGFDPEKHSQFMTWVRLATFSDVDQTHVQGAYLQYAIHSPDQP